MKKLVSAALGLFLCLSVQSLEVDRNEVAAAEIGNAIEFVNYTGPYSVISTAEEISGIGTSLGTAAAGISSGSGGSVGEADRYSVIHAVDPSVTTGFDADILVLGKDVGVDHIDNLRRIIAAYLSAAYGYSRKDSATLATFITVYNAVYRGKMDIFTGRYKKVVTGNLSAEKAGLSVLYSEWPGRSQIVIPLSEARLAGTVSTIDTTTLTDKSVVGKMKEEPGSGVDTRKDMVELKEKESAAAQDRAGTAQESAARARTDQAVKKDELAEAQKAAAVAETAAAEAQKAAAAKPQDSKAQEKAAGTRKAADEQAAVVEEKKAAAAETDKKVAASESAAKADQTLADTKQKEAAAERKDIAVDVQKNIDTAAATKRAADESSLASAMPGYALRIVDESSLLAELVLVNLNDGSAMKTSPLNTIRSRSLYDTGAGLIMIAGKKGGNAAVRLVLVDPESLEVRKQGTDTIAEISMLVRNGSDYYAVIEQEGGNFVLGRFDGNLEAKAKSAVPVKPFTAIIVTDKGVLVQNDEGSVRLLRSTDLTDQSK